MITKFALFALLNYGICNIAIYGTIFEGWRNFWEKLSPNFFGKLMNCMICLPFWTGLILSFLFFGQYSTDFYNMNGWWTIFFDGCITSGSVWLIHNIQYAIERTNNSEFK